MSMKSIGCVGSAVLLAGGWVTPATALDSEESALTANIGVTSNYVWRGVTQTGNDAAVQGGIDYGHGSGFYVGTWLSNVNFGDSAESTTTLVTDKDGVPITDDNGENQYETTTEFSSGAEYELDAYLGWGGNLTENVGLDVGYVYYHYGQYESGSDFGEVYLNVGFWWFDAGIYYTTNSQIDDPDDTEAFVVGDLAYFLGFSIDLAQSWSLGLTVGQYDFKNDGNRDDDGFKNDLSYTWGQIDLTKSAGRYGDFTLSVSKAGEEADPDDNAKIFITWTKGWSQKKG